MRFKDYINICEATYDGNIGMAEMFRFYEVASKKQVSEMRSLLVGKQFKKAWEFLQQVVGVKLK